MEKLLMRIAGFFKNNGVAILIGFLEYILFCVAILAAMTDLDIIDFNQILDPAFIVAFLSIGLILLVVEAATPDWDVFHWIGCTALASLAFALTSLFRPAVNTPNLWGMTYVVAAVNASITTIFHVAQSRKKRSLRAQRITMGLLMSIIISVIYTHTMAMFEDKLSTEFCAYASGICPALTMIFSLKFCLWQENRSNKKNK